MPKRLDTYFSTCYNLHHHSIRHIWEAGTQHIAKMVDILAFLSHEYRKISLVCQAQMTHTTLWIDLFGKTESRKKISEIAEVETILGTYFGIG